MYKFSVINPHNGKIIEIVASDKCCKPECNVEIIHLKGYEAPDAQPGYHGGYACCREHSGYYCSCGDIHSYTTKVGKKHLSWRKRDLEPEKYQKTARGIVTSIDPLTGDLIHLQIMK
jgi:hypothetical protein